MILRATRLSATGNNGGAAPIISGFAYPANVLTSTRAGQWFVNDVAVIGETGSTYTVRLTDIGALIQCGNSNVLTCWHPNQIAAVARFRAAAFRANTLSGISPNVQANDGSAIRRVVGLISGDFADQATAANQPIYRLTGQGGNPSWEFDGAGDILNLTSNSLYQNVGQGYLIAACQDTNRTGGATDHHALLYSHGASPLATRFGIFTRAGGASTFTAGARRNDNDSFTGASIASDGNANVLTAHGDWSNGFVRLMVNGVLVASSALSGGAGLTQNTPSQAVNIGGNGPSTFPGHIASTCEIVGSISATDLSRIHRYMGLLIGRTDINLV